MTRKNNKINTGYTIIETMITVSIFLIVVVIGMGAILNTNLIHNKSQNMRSIMDSLSFIMEDMSRNIRTGYNYRCVSNLSDLSVAVIGTPLSGSSCQGIAFEFSTGNSLDNNDQWVYYISGGNIIKWNQGNDHTLLSNYDQLTPDEVIIDQVGAFSVLGALPGSVDNQQPLVTIKLVGHINFQNTITPFSLQTSVSQRARDL
jgi:type II secretory pathway pseudopilin PulG